MSMYEPLPLAGMVSRLTREQDREHYHRVIQLSINVQNRIVQAREARKNMMEAWKAAETEAARVEAALAKKKTPAAEKKSAEKAAEAETKVETKALPHAEEEDPIHAGVIRKDEPIVIETKTSILPSTATETSPETPSLTTRSSTISSAGRDSDISTTTPASKRLSSRRSATLYSPQLQQHMPLPSMKAHSDDHAKFEKQIERMSCQYTEPDQPWNSQIHILSKSTTSFRYGFDTSKSEPTPTTTAESSLDISSFFDKPSMLDTTSTSNATATTMAADSILANNSSISTDKEDEEGRNSGNYHDFIQSIVQSMDTSTDHAPSAFSLGPAYSLTPTTSTSSTTLPRHAHDDDSTTLRSYGSQQQQYKDVLLRESAMDNNDDYDGPDNSQELQDDLSYKRLQQDNNSAVSDMPLTPPASPHEEIHQKMAMLPAVVQVQKKRRQGLRGFFQRSYQLDRLTVYPRSDTLLWDCHDPVDTDQPNKTILKVVLRVTGEDQFSFGLASEKIVKPTTDEADFLATLPAAQLAEALSFWMAQQRGLPSLSRATQILRHGHKLHIVY